MITVHDPMGPVGVKWNGKSTHQLRTMIEQQREIGRALYVVQQQMEAAATALETEINTELVRLLDRADITDPAYIARARGW